MKEVNAQVPVWGFSGSPLVIDERVIIYAGGNAPHGLCTFDAGSGAPVWQIESSGMNFSSAQRIELEGRKLAVFGDSRGVMAIDPATGNVVWQYKPRH